MNITFLLTALGIAFYSAFNLAIKLASDKINGLFGSMLIATSGVIAMAMILLVQYFRGQPVDLAITRNGVVFSIIAGLAVISFDVVLYALFDRDAPISVVIPAIQVGTIIVLFLIGIFAFQETVTAAKILGLVLAASGMFLLLR